MPASSNAQRWWISLAGVASVAIGLVVLAGWYWHQMYLVQIAPNLAPMQRNTATGFILCGAGFLCTSEACRGPLYARLCGLMAATLGLLTLSEYVLSINLHIDQFLGPAVAMAKAPYPGRMSVLTAFSFALTGAALFAGSGRASQRKEVALAIGGSLVSAIALASIFSYFLGTGVAFGWSQVSFMAAHTAVACVLLGSGLVVRATAMHSGTRENPVPEKLPPRWLPWCLYLVLITILLSLWQAVMASTGPASGASRLGGALAAFLLVSFILFFTPVSWQDKVTTGVGLGLLVVTDLRWRALLSRHVPERC